MRRRVRHLTVLLIKEHLQTCDDALKAPDTLAKYNLRLDLPFEGAFYVSRPHRKTPPWVQFVREGITDEIAPLENVSSAAVLFVQACSRIFAFTFGYGRNLLKPDCFEMDFGLKVALNTIDPDRLRSLDVRTFEELTVDTRRQTSRDSPLETFALDISRDLLRAVTGEPREHTFAKRITGKDAIALNVQIEFSSLGRKCEEMWNAYGGEKYKERFGWIDHLRTVRDRSLVEILDRELLTALNDQNTERCHLAPPEPLDWERVESFCYSTEQGEEASHSDLDIGDYLGTLENPDALSLQDVKRDCVHVRWVEQEQTISRWSVYECIVFETEYQGALYVLTANQWFQVAGHFAEEVNDVVSRLAPSDSELPNAEAGEREADYNRRVAEQREEIILMDQKLVRCSGVQGRIEVCDLLTCDREFIHVKRKTRSATLSHLFAQGTVSAEAFLRDAAFRQDAKEHVASTRPNLAHLIPDDRPRPTDYTITYAIITKPSSNWPLSLPFFSRLHLMQAAQRLAMLGYKVSLLCVKET
ncbi:MAG: TIGR04141 family sporadically distributed protein [Candidatus Eisenbacteria bacterium]|nr:TIGR04141 family sporadically distributed protein [Candidatus Eisenbacteria bacterium]